MKLMRCEKCRKRDATVHLTVIGASPEVSHRHYCATCYRAIEEKEGASLSKNLELPAVASEAKALPKKAKAAERKSRKREFPKGLWAKCPGCGEMVFTERLKENLRVCPNCEFHFRASARERIGWLLEPDSFKELDARLKSVDVLRFTGPTTYKAKLAADRKATGLKDAVITGIGRIAEHRTGVGVLDFSFLGGSMGSVVGERLARLIETCTKEGLPVVIISASGGARMQEGMFSLMQMAKTCGALARHNEAGLPFISVLTDPTMGGVTASFASAGSLILAEPGAMIGFAGARVVKQTTRRELPAGFQTAEFLLERGLIDAIVPRRGMKKRLIGYLDFLMVGQKRAVAG